MKKKVKVELRKLNTMTETEASEIQDVWQLDLNSRWQLYRYYAHSSPLPLSQPMLFPQGVLFLFLEHNTPPPAVASPRPSAVLTNDWLHTPTVLSARGAATG